MNNETIASNPLYGRLAGHSRWLPGQMAVAVGFLAGVLSLALVLGLSQLGWQKEQLEELDVFEARILFIQFVILILALVVTVHLVSNDTNSETYQLTYLTALPSAKIVMGYFRAALFRLRLAAILMVVLSPIWCMSAIYSANVPLDYIRGDITNCVTDACRNQYLHGFRLQTVPLQQILGVAVLCLEPWGLGLLAIAIGVTWGLRPRSAAWTITSILGAALLLPLLLLILFSMPEPYFIQLRGEEFTLVTALPYAITPYLLTVGVLLVATRWARKPLPQA